MVPAGKAQPVTLEWKPGAFRADFYYLLGQLWDGDEEIDRIESAFLVWSEKAIAKGPALNFRDNYLRLGTRPMFLFGTDDWAYTFTTRRETPLQWLRDMRARRDFGVQIYENLQFGIPAPEKREELLRKVDGIVQLAQEYQQVYFAGLLIGYNVAASDAELAQQAAWCRDFAQRYAQVPGLIYYLNGDLRCQLSDAVTPQLNQFLQQRYGSDERLRAAWGDEAPAQPLGRIPAEDFNDWGHSWEDGQVCDLNRFRAALIRRWSEALIRGIREFDSRHPTSSEFYQLPHQGVDIPAGIDGLDLCNFGYFDKPGADIARFPAICKYNDQRARGKSVGPGEYGVKTHPAWGDGQDYGYHITRTPEQAASLFLAIAHYSLGLGRLAHPQLVLEGQRASRLPLGHGLSVRRSAQRHRLCASQPEPALPPLRPGLSRAGSLCADRRQPSHGRRQMAGDRGNPEEHSTSRSPPTLTTSARSTKTDSPSRHRPKPSSIPCPSARRMKPSPKSATGSAGAACSTCPATFPTTSSTNARAPIGWRSCAASGSSPRTTRTSA